MEKPYGKVEISWHKVLRKLSEAGILLLTPLYKKPFKTEDIVFLFPHIGFAWKVTGVWQQDRNFQTIVFLGVTFNSLRYNLFLMKPQFSLFPFFLVK